MEQGIVLLPASQIFTDDSSEAASPEVKGHLSNGRPVYSTGKLERALVVGHRVLVPTTRSVLLPHDQWWVKLVGRGNVFLADSPVEKANYSTGWRKAMNSLGYEWPTCRQVGLGNSTLPLSWGQMQDMLGNYGILDGCKL